MAFSLVAPAGNALAASTYKFVSMPDYWNADIGDVSGSPYYRADAPNSTNASYQAADDFILSSIQAEGITDMYSVGDFVEGHWAIDTLGTGNFGPLTTPDEKRASVKLSGDTYYPQVMNRFTSHGFTLYPGLGDHEIGDNDWKKADPSQSFKYYNMGTFKYTYSRNMMQTSPGVYRFSNRPIGQAKGTAYAVRPNPNVQLITLDVFSKSTSNIIAQLDADQYAWVEKVLKKANADGVKWIIVQGHTPIVSPVRKSRSSGMIYQNGTKSALWSLLKKYKVDVYLAGEVHDVTGHYVDGIAQISHGGLAYWGDANYIVGEITDDTLKITSKRFTGTADWTNTMWQTDMTKAKPISVTYDGNPAVTAGEMTITSSNTLVSRSGNLDVYTP